MGRPIKKEFIGKLPNSESTLEVIIDEAYIPGASSVSNDVTIVNQKGTGIYTVTDGTNTGRVKLVSGDTTLVAGLAHSKVTISSSTGELAYTTKDITLSTGGTGYVVGDVITVGVAGTATVGTVTTAVPGGEITGGTPTVSTDSLTADPKGSDVEGTGGKGTGSTFDVVSTSTTTYLPTGISLVSGGTGYAVNDTVTLVNTGVVTVATVDANGVILTITSTLNQTPKTTDMAGASVIQETSGSGTGATFSATSSSTTTYTVDSITLSKPGTGYEIGDSITVGTAGTYSVTAVSTAVIGGTIETITATKSTTEETSNFAGTISGTGGTGTGATFDVTTNSGTEETVEYSRVIFNRTVSTFEGNIYSWNLDGTEEATLATKTRS